ncbi:unnamed protein product, partial [Rotaria sp. Silwood2]
HRLKQLNPKNKYCSRCQHEFAHRADYLRHMRKVHQGYFAITLNNKHTSERNKSYIKTNALISDQSTIYFDTGNGME